MISQSALKHRLVWAVGGFACVTFCTGARGCFGGDTSQPQVGGVADASSDDVIDAGSNDADATSDAHRGAAFRPDASDARGFVFEDADASLDADATLCPSADDCLVGGGGYGDDATDDGDALDETVDDNYGDATPDAAPAVDHCILLASECNDNTAVPACCKSDAAVPICCNSGLLSSVSLGPIPKDKSCVCGLQPGQPCMSGESCCNTAGGTSSTGTWVQASGCPWNNGGGASCTLDSDCEVGYACKTLHAHCIYTAPTYSCMSDSNCYPNGTLQTCVNAPTSWNECWPVCAPVGTAPYIPSDERMVFVGCCDGLVEVPINGGPQTSCLIPSGGICFEDWLCASGHCVAGVTTAVCQ